MSDQPSIEDLAARLAAVEDELAIIRLVASYGPLVDTGDPQAPAHIIATDGVYDVGGGMRLEGREAFTQMLSGSDHQDIVAGGIVHAMGLPWVRVDGDKAIATNTTQLFQRDGDGYSIFRVAQNVWHLERGPDGWQIRERYNRLIGPDGEAVNLLRNAAAQG